MKRYYEWDETPLKWYKFTIYFRLPFSILSLIVSYANTNMYYYDLGYSSYDISQMIWIDVVVLIGAVIFAVLANIFLAKRKKAGIVFLFIYMTYALFIQMLQFILIGDPQFLANSISFLFFLIVESIYYYKRFPLFSGKKFDFTSGFEFKLGNSIANINSVGRKDQSFSEPGNTEAFANLLFGGAMDDSRTNTFLTNSLPEEPDYGLSQRNAIGVSSKEEISTLLENIVDLNGRQIAYSYGGWENINNCNGLDCVTISRYLINYGENKNTTFYFCLLKRNGILRAPNGFAISSINNTKSDEHPWRNDNLHIKKEVSADEKAKVSSPMSVSMSDTAKQLRLFKQLLDEELITEQDYETKKKQLLGI